MQEPKPGSDNKSTPSAGSRALADAPSFADVLDAAQRLRGKAVVTPLLESPALNALVGGRLLIKAEVLQRTGAFKFRGAYNSLSRLQPQATPPRSSSPIRDPTAPMCTCMIATATTAKRLPSGWRQNATPFSIKRSRTRK
jgi:hypothetical protein